MGLEKKVLQFMNLGETEYYNAISIQEKLYSLRKCSKIPDTVMLLHYKPLITKGLDNSWNKIHATEEELKKNGIHVYQEDRGGGTAYLGPGQLIAYLIFNIKEHGLSIPQYYHKLEEVAAKFAGNYQIPVNFETEILEVDTKTGKKGKAYLSTWYRKDGKNSKFFSQGHRIPDYNTTKFGLVIYVNNEAKKHMHLVNQCGFDSNQVGIVSVEEITKNKINMEEAKKVLLNSMKEVFGFGKVEESKKEVSYASS